MSNTATAHATEHAHPTPATYAKIAAILCGITAVEFICFYIQALRPVFVPLLLTLSAIKFSLVAMYYMHLKFDNKVFARLLVGGLALGAAVLLWLFALFTFSHPLLRG
jgi:cytochrome c oxidase subunit 4